MERRPKPFLLRGGSVVQWFSSSVVDNLIELIAAGF